MLGQAISLFVIVWTALTAYMLGVAVGRSSGRGLDD